MRSSSYVLATGEGGLPNSLAISRVSRGIHKEFRRQMYKDLDIEFTVEEFVPHADFFGRGIESVVGCSVQHRRYRRNGGIIFQTFITTNREKQATRIYKSIDYSSFASVQIGLSSSPEADPGKILMSFDAVRFLGHILKGKDLHTLKLNVSHDFNLDSLTDAFIPGLSELLAGGNLRLLMLPLGRLLRKTTKKTEIEMEAPIKIHKQFWQQDLTKLKNPRIITPNRLVVTLPSPPKAQGSNFDWHRPYKSPFGDSWTVRRVKSFLDMQLDRASRAAAQLMMHYRWDPDMELEGLSGGAAERVVHHRWDAWTKKYEIRLIKDISLWDHQTQHEYYTVLAERWAVWRTMEKRLLAKDRAGWHDREDEPLQNPRWVFDVEYVPTYRDRAWERLKYDGLFYDRRILVTPTGLQWHPEDVEHSPDRGLKLPETIYFEHKPPKRPERRPGGRRR